ncbi:hypothetical protein A1O1_07204 [Capronia coronata CBS 617.96]|uniref:Zn(2)-C6 fungal-type domain-containing protein n=1 Tax=Capronia coronata CBS 617.96 TaxID=1182541 RepID=W9Y2W7_9EURO|nr:uncharacterized protein A1O1_07204 [Capronia coronata CBS 617.96]EXJ83581.1 hypothetical protein A1O1_07204 [Capronia coronata CBS 617.96]
MPSGTRSNKTNITACIRCRRKKKRCDQKLPRCSLCELAGTECVNYDALTSRHVPRSYVRDLEERIALLESKLQEHHIHDTDHETTSRSPTTSVTVPASHLADSYPPNRPRQNVEAHPPTPMNNTLDTTLAMALAQHGPTEEPALSDVLLTELMRTKITPHGAERPDLEQGLQEKALSPDEFDTSPISMPTREGAQNLFRAYFNFANQSLPLLHEPTLVQKFELLSSTTRTVDLTEASTDHKLAVFFVFEVFAVALLLLQKYDPWRIPTSMAERYHKTALKAINEAGLPSDVRGVQALLLIAQYSYHHPIEWATWKTVGTAMRLAVELGLHQEPPPSHKLDDLTLEDRRRTFWVAYSMDINISITLGLPSSLSDGVIMAKVFSQENDENITSNGIVVADESTPKPKRVALHLLRYRQLQSEMRVVLYEKPPAPLAYIPVDLSVWQQQMCHRLQSWYNDTPRPETLTHREHKNLENFEVTYYAALLYLYQPSLNIPTPSEQGLLALADAASNTIQLYRRFFTKHQLTIYWLAVETLFSAGTALMYAYVKSHSVQERITFRHLESLVRTCSSVLWGMVEHFPNFRGKRDAFDLVVSRTLADLSSRSSVNGRMATTSMHDKNAGHSHIEHNRNRADLDCTAAGWRHGQRPPESETGSADAAQFSDTPTPDNDRYHNQYLQLLSLTAGVESSGSNTPQAPFSFAELDQISFDWGALENTADFPTPSWL